MPVQSVEPQRLYRQIAEQLISLISRGEFKLGERLPAERDLALQLGVSRPSVREALIALEVQGWVEVRMGSGVYVLPKTSRKQPKRGATLSPAEWGPLELIRARRLVEGEVAAMAAKAARRKDLQAMAQALDTMRGDAANGVMPLAGDRAFHTAIVLCCGNAVLTETIQNFWDSRRGPLFERLGDYFETTQSWRAAIGEHEAVYEAIRSHDASAARSAMHKHMDKSHTRFSASWQRAKKHSYLAQHPS